MLRVPNYSKLECLVFKGWGLQIHRLFGLKMKGDGHFIGKVLFWGIILFGQFSNTWYGYDAHMETCSVLSWNTLSPGWVSRWPAARFKTIGKIDLRVHLRRKYFATLFPSNYSQFCMAQWGDWITVSGCCCWFVRKMTGNLSLSLKVKPDWSLKWEILEMYKIHQQIKKPGQWSRWTSFVDTNYSKDC